MSWKNSESRYGTASITLHWLMVLLLAAVYACIELRGLFPKDSPERDLMKQWHFMLGLSVFALVWLRIALRAISPTPRIEPAPPAWQMLPAKLMHLALYLLMIGLPFAGLADPQRRRQAGAVLRPGAAAAGGQEPRPGQADQAMA